MTDDTRLEERLTRLGNEIAPDTAFADAVMRRVGETQIAAPSRAARALAAVSTRPRRLVMAACAVALAVSLIWPMGKQGPERWWLAPSAAAAQEISNTLAQAQVDGIEARSTTAL
jgi:hypothetical protein